MLLYIVIRLAKGKVRLGQVSPCFVKIYPTKNSLSLQTLARLTKIFELLFYLSIVIFIIYLFILFIIYFFFSFLACLIRDFFQNYKRQDKYLQVT